MTVLIAILMLVLLASGCSLQKDAGGAAPVINKEHGNSRVFRVNLTSNPTTLDPIQASSESELLLVRALYDTLVDYQGGEVKPALAESWSYSANGRELYIKLRKDLKFSNGHPLTAADVEFSLERALGTGASPYTPLVTAFIGNQSSVVSSIELVNPSALIIRFPSSRRDFIEMLAHTCFSIVSKEEVEQNHLAAPGTYFTSSTNFAGSGSLRMVDWVDSKELTLEPNPHYYGGTPKLDRLELVIDSSVETTMYDFGAENLDLVYLQSGDVKTLELEYPFIGERLAYGLTSMVYFLYLNPQTELLKSLEARRAVVAAIDLSQLAEASEMFEVSEFPLGRPSRGNGLYTGSPRTLFSSFSNGKPQMTVSFPPGDVSRFIAENLKNQLEHSLGIKVNLKESPEANPVLFDGSAHLSLIPWVVPSSGKTAFYPYFYGKGLNPFVNGNYLGEAGRGYFQQAGITADPQQREKDYALISDEICRECLLVGLVDVKNLYAVQEGIRIPAGLEGILGIGSQKSDS